MKNFKIKKIDFPLTLSKEFLVFLGNFDKSPSMLFEEIIFNKINRIALMFDVNSDGSSFEVVNVISDELKTIEIQSNYSMLNRTKKQYQKLVFTGFKLDLKQLVVVRPSENKSLISGLKSHFDLVLGAGVLKAEFELISNKNYEKLLTEKAA